MNLKNYCYFFIGLTLYKKRILVKKIILAKLRLLVVNLILATFIVCYSTDQTYFGNYFDSKNTEIVEIKKTKRSCVTIIKHRITGDYYCVKQLFAETSSCVIRSIYEVFVSYIAVSADIPMNRVCLILPGDDFPGKQDRMRLATLHTFIPGRPVLRKEPYYGIDLKQKKKRIFNKVTVPRGLAKEIIISMAVHTDLPKIVAFDTFVGNADRSKDNLFYNKSTDRFFGIDLERSLTYNLCGIAREQIKKMLHDKTLSFTKKEIKALVIFRSTLRSLIKHNFPKKSLKKINNLIKMAKFYGNNISNNKLCHINDIIIEGHADAKRLVVLIGKLIKSYKR